MKKLYLVRHGETDWNLAGKTQGIKDSQLTKQGLLQATDLGKRLINEDIGKIYSSHLARAKSTAMIIGDILKIPCYYNESLSEINFGQWEGLTIEEIIEKHPNEYNKWRTEPHLACIPEGEALKFAQKRIIKSIEDILTNSKPNNLLIVSHSTIIKLFLLYIMGIDLCNYNKLKQDNCCINVIGYGNYGPVLLKYNDTCHTNKYKW